MKKIFYLAFATASFVSYSQTPLIAHKSHSGVAATYLIDPSANFGEVEFFPPPSPIENFIPVNDTVVMLEVTDQNQKVLKKEILPNKEHLSIDVFQVKYRDSIEKQKRYEENLRIQQEQQIQEQQTIEEQTVEKQKSKKKKGDLLLLSFLVGGGLFGFIALYKRLIYRTAV